MPRYRTAGIYRAHAIELYAFNRAFIGGVAMRLDRRMDFALSISERELFLTLGSETFSGAMVRHPIA